MNAFFSNCRGALRLAAKHRTFTATAVLTLALGIGGLTIVFTVLDAVSLHALPYPHPDRIVMLTQIGQRQPVSAAVSVPNFRDWQVQARSFEALTAVGGGHLSVIGIRYPEQLDVGTISVEFFQVFGVRPAVGRLFRSDEEHSETSHVAVISDALWARQFDRASDAIGSIVLIDGRSATIVGVMPGDFRVLGTTPDVLVPLAFDVRYLADRAAQRLTVFGRLKPGVTLETAQSEMSTIARRLENAYPDVNRGMGIRVQAYSEFVATYYGPKVWVIFGAMTLVLLIACLNVANLQLARLRDRAQEIAVRLALGATRQRVMGQLLTEAALVALLGGVVALLFASVGIRIVSRQAPPGFFAVRTPSLDLRAFGILLSVTGLSTLASGLLPSLRISRYDPAEFLQNGRTSTDNRSWRRLRRLLVVCQTALSTILLVGASVLLRDLIVRWSSDLGFAHSDKLDVRVDLPRPRYQAPQSRLDFFQAASNQLEKVPGVRSVAAANYVPFDRYSFNTFLRVEGLADNPFLKSPSVQYRAVSPNYFEEMRIPINSGRAFARRDDQRAPGTAIISETLRHRLFGSETGTGQHVSLRIWNPTGTRAGDSLEMNAEIIGVVGDVTDVRIGGTPRPIVYVPYLQRPDSTVSFVIAVSHEDPAQMTAIRRAISAVDDSVPVASAETFDLALGRQMADPRFLASVMSAFALVALALAAVGLYAVMAEGIAERSRELAIRIAMGATPNHVGRLILQEGGLMGLVGFVLGGTAALGVPHVLSAFTVTADRSVAPMLLLTSVIFVLVSAIAMGPLTRRAVRVDPSAALRAE
jgi:putative ABC transport system permease protein